MALPKIDHNDNLYSQVASWEGPHHLGAKAEDRASPHKEERCPSVEQGGTGLVLAGCRRGVEAGSGMSLLPQHADYQHLL